MDEFVRRPKRPRIDVNDRRTQAAVSTPPKATQQAAPPLPERDSQPDHELLAHNPRKHRFKMTWPPQTKKQFILTGLALVLLLSIGGAALYYFVFKDEAPVATIQPEPEPEPEPEPVPTTEASRLSGRQVAFEVNDRPIYAVQIENSPEARPQSGLAEADIVFEAVAEGGITRFNALFQDNQPANIGPVRSLRPYYIDWFWPFDASIVHAGGSPEALNDVRTLNLKDMDHGANGSTFKRISSRYSPHNLYTSDSALRATMTSRGQTSSTPTSFPRKEPQPAETPVAGTINLKISSNLYNVVFTYDKTTNSYLRNQGGGAHVDAESGQQLRTDVIVVPVLTKGIHPDRVHTQYGTVGSGKVYVFQDGIMTEGTWTKSARNAQWQFKTAAGEEIKFNPGKTWVTIIDKAESVSATP